MSIHDDLSFSRAVRRDKSLVSLAESGHSHVMQPLHVSSPLPRPPHALADDRLITMAILEPGWEGLRGASGLFSMGCLGKIAAHHRLEDGSSNQLLYGLARVRLIEELAPNKTYREAHVQTCEDASTLEDAASCALQRKPETSCGFFRTCLRQEQWDHVLGSDISLGALTDIIAYVLDVKLSRKSICWPKSMSDAGPNPLGALGSSRLLAPGSMSPSFPNFSVN